MYLLNSTIIPDISTAMLGSILGFTMPLESLSRRRFCQHGRQPEVNRAVIDGE